MDLRNESVTTQQVENIEEQNNLDELYEIGQGVGLASKKKKKYHSSIATIEFNNEGFVNVGLCFW